MTLCTFRKMKQNKTNMLPRTYLSPVLSLCDCFKFLNINNKLRVYHIGTVDDTQLAVMT